MKAIRFYFTMLLCFFCLGTFADERTKSVEFFPTDNGPQYPHDIDLLPFSNVLPPEGYLKDDILYIRMNTTSLYTNIKIDKDGEGIVYADCLTHDADKVVDYDLSMYGSGEYTVTISFSNGETYEAVFDIE